MSPFKLLDETTVYSPTGNLPKVICANPSYESEFVLPYYQSSGYNVFSITLASDKDATDFIPKMKTVASPLCTIHAAETDINNLNVFRVVADGDLTYSNAPGSGVSAETGANFPEQMKFSVSGIQGNAFVRVLRVCDPSLMVADEIGVVDRLLCASDLQFTQFFGDLFGIATVTQQQLSNPVIYDVVTKTLLGNPLFDIPCEVKNVYALVDNNFVRGIECNYVDIETADATSSPPVLLNFGSNCAFTINSQNRRRCTILIQTFGFCLTITQQPDRGACPECKIRLNFEIPLTLGCYRIVNMPLKLGLTNLQLSDAKFQIRRHGEKIKITSTDFRGNIVDSMPAPFYLFDEKISTENDVSLTAHDLKRNLFSRQTKTFNFETEQLPAYAHANLLRMMTADKCEINKIWLDDFEDYAKRVLLTKESKQEYDAGPPKRLSKGEGELQVSEQDTVNEYD